MRNLNTKRSGPWSVRSFGLAIAMLFGCATAAMAQGAEKLVLTHYMPWYQEKSVSGYWGWHWTMNAFDPEGDASEGRVLASHFTPMIGAYDSSDPHVIEYHLLLMKLSGIDGVVIDWYGREEFRDYAELHRSSQVLVEQIQKLGMHFAVCYEDQTVSALVMERRLARKNRVKHALSDLNWLSEHWFSLPSYVRLEGDPVLLSFGLEGLSNSEWTECLDALDTEVAYFSEHHRRDAAVGAFDWPIPAQGVERIELFNRESEVWPHAIRTAFPRFKDIYKEAGVGEGWGSIEDENGETFRRTLANALAGEGPFVQLVTWNDWGEGTMIEPSEEFGFRDLLEVRRQRNERFGETDVLDAEDLSLVVQLYHARKQGLDTESLDEVSRLLGERAFEEAEAALVALRERSS